MRRKLWLVLLVAVVVAAASGYWLMSRGGPLLNNHQQGGGLSLVCLPAKTWPATYSVGQATLKNTGRFDATITKASLIEPSDVELLGAFAAKYPADIYDGKRLHFMQVGAERGWPPVGSEGRRKWEERKPARGHVVESGKQVLFVYGLRAGGPATTKGLRVEYETWLGLSYTATVYPQVVIVPDCDRQRKYVDLDRLDAED